MNVWAVSRLLLLQMHIVLDVAHDTGSGVAEEASDTHLECLFVTECVSPSLLRSWGERQEHLLRSPRSHTPVQPLNILKSHSH